ncbi:MULTISPECIES: AAA family ATPase [Shewanella]|jgi:predicted ATPase|uniref:AAA family ATPase n=1 Tax=Shewanella TaxID=22 RepID=UPI00057B6FAE|nr:MULTISPECIES: AAA family ATPase [Shewanella]MBO2689392.1 AAA family ATPase [Shewanella algae]NDO76589.1 AAA family ATPase [Shewanella sp. SE1]OIN06734.1 AAA family ATPase [Shewanella algae]
MFLKSVELKREKINNWDLYPFNIASISKLHKLTFTSNLTFLVGENGSGKSTMIEALAIALGFNSEGGTKNFQFSTRQTHSELYQYLRLCFNLQKPQDGFFYRAESFYNVASNIDELNMYGLKSLLPSYGGRSLHEQSHGESFLSLVLNRFSGNSLFILDEPEASLSPTRQMTFMATINQLIQKNSQFIIATHSPILLSYPNSTIYRVSEDGFNLINYEETDAYQITQAFLKNPNRMFRELFK